MRLVGCDRCGTTFSITTKRTEVQVSECTGDCDMIGEPTLKELCPVCRRDLDEWFNDVAAMHDAERAAAPAPMHAVQLDAAPKKVDGRANRKLPEERTCEVCGRTGFLRFVETPTGWRCSPTATKCPGHQQQAAPPPPAAEPVTVNHRADEHPAALPAGITAKCQDCSRSWQLTGRPLAQAVEMHELKHSHIVDVAEEATDG